MARRNRSRFSRLNEQLRNIGGVPSGTGATTEYFRYLTGQKKLTIPNAIDGAARQIIDVGVIPFATTPTGTTPANRYRHGITAYSYNGLRDRTGNLTLSDFGVYLLEGGEQINDNFFPALLRCSYTRSGATNNPAKRSGITNEPYSYTPKRTFSFPLGRTVSVFDAEDGAAETSINEVDELDVVKSLVSWVKAGKKDSDTATITEGNKAISVSYEPEKFAPARSNQEAPNTTITGVSVN